MTTFGGELAQCIIHISSQCRLSGGGICFGLEHLERKRVCCSLIVCRGESRGGIPRGLGDLGLVP